MKNPMIPAWNNGIEDVLSWSELTVRCDSGSLPVVVVRPDSARQLNLWGRSSCIVRGPKATDKATCVEADYTVGEGQIFHSELSKAPNW